MSEIGITSTGQVFNPAERQNESLLQQTRPGEHVWILAVSYRISPENLRRGMDGLEPVMMDTENIAFVTAGCFVCEVAYEKRLTFRKCPGEPPSSILRPR
jgi:hypothetical protein